MTKNKPILINGFPRSGTTYLALQLYKSFSNTLIEPLLPNIGSEILSNFKNRETPSTKSIHKKLSEKYLFKSYIDCFGDKIFKIIQIYHPSLDKNSFFFDYFRLRSYLKFFISCNIKSIRLHYYLDSRFIKKNWEVYHIIRHPIDTFISYTRSFLPKFSLKYIYSSIFGSVRGKLFYKFVRFISKDTYIDGLVHTNWVKAYNLFVDEYTKTKIKELSYLHKWLLLYITSNYSAISYLDRSHIIIYDKPESYKSLPFKLIDPLKIKIYRGAREVLEDSFYKISKELDLENQYEKIIKFFE